MRTTLLTVLFLFSLTSIAQSVDAYLESIRDNEAALTAFFSAMPKGGDLHYHYHGSVYAETFIDIAITHNFYIHLITLAIADAKPTDITGWTTFSALAEQGLLEDYKQRLLQKWSAKDFNYVDYPSHRQFFESFDHFSAASSMSFESGLLEIKNRAKQQNISYIEMMFNLVASNKSVKDLIYLDKRLRTYQGIHNATATSLLLDSVYTQILKRNISEDAITFNTNLTNMHNELSIDNATFTLRYQTFVLRFFNPVDLFKDLILAFESANRSKLVVGVNIVSPEHGEISMKDYWLHMQMFSYLHSKYPSVKYSLHAGELALGLVKPEDLTWHISAAVHDGKAYRIGHGVDLPYEKDCFSLLRYMSRNNIAIEINLYSNEFILKVKEGRHPVSLYYDFHVPVVISSDDEGVLRTSLTEQFVLLAKRYKQIKYADIKKFVYNSINYSFIEEPALKDRLKTNLDVSFKTFENTIQSIGNTK